MFFFIFSCIGRFSHSWAWKCGAAPREAVAPPLETGTNTARRLHTAARPNVRRDRARLSLAIGSVIFFLLPRFNGGYMSGFNLQCSTLISGFSDDVELGEIGEIKKSSVLVMRISVDGGQKLLAARIGAESR